MACLQNVGHPNQFDTILLGFANERVHTKGCIDLLDIVGRPEARCIVMVRYLITEAGTSYNILIRRKRMNRLGVVVSTLHMEMMFPTEDQSPSITAKTDPKEVNTYYVMSLNNITICAPYKIVKHQLFTFGDNE